jgi:hypothetical protein
MDPLRDPINELRPVMINQIQRLILAFILSVGVILALSTLATVVSGSVSPIWAAVALGLVIVIQVVVLFGPHLLKIRSMRRSL